MILGFGWIGIDIGITWIIILLLLIIILLIILILILMMVLVLLVGGVDVVRIEVG